jgi:hypothetical protein
MARSGTALLYFLITLRWMFRLGFSFTQTQKQHKVLAAG